MVIFRHFFVFFIYTDLLNEFNFISWRITSHKSYLSYYFLFFCIFARNVCDFRSCIKSNISLQNNSESWFDSPVTFVPVYLTKNTLITEIFEYIQKYSFLETNFRTENHFIHIIWWPSSQPELEPSWNKTILLGSTPKLTLSILNSVRRVVKLVQISNILVRKNQTTTNLKHVEILHALQHFFYLRKSDLTIKNVIRLSSFLNAVCTISDLFKESFNFP